MKSTILIEGITYTADFLLNTVKGQKILKKARDDKKKTKTTNIYCICNGKNNPIPMHAKKKPNSNDYTLGRNPNTMHLHNPDCIRYLDEAEKKLVIKDNNIIKDVVDGEEWKKVNLTLNNYKIQYSISPKNTRNKARNISTIYLYSSLYVAIDKITTFSWYKYVKNQENKFNPKEGNLFHTMYTQTDNIKILHPNREGKKTNYTFVDINKLLFKPYSKTRNEDVTNQLLKERKHITPTGIETFKTLIIGKYLEHEISKPNLIKIKTFDPYLKNYYFIYSDNPNIVNKLKSIPNAELYIIAYIVPKNDLPMIEVMESMSVLPERGIYVDNPFEIQFAKELIDRNILFIRPPRTEHIYYHFFKDHIPDFILLDKEKRKFATICEVFKYSKNDRRKTSQKYWQIMNKKKRYYNTIHDKYNLLYWYAGDGDKLPNIYQPKLKN